MAKSRQAWTQWGGTAGVLAALLSGWSCTKVVEQKPPRNPPLIGAQWRVLPTGEAPLRMIRAYAESLEFNTAPPLADQRLADFVRDTVGVGDTVRIEPVSGAYLFDSTELAQGRIVARIWSKQVYRPAGFGPWWTYWWIDGSGQGGSWRSVFISKDTLTARAMTYHHGHYDIQCDPGRTCARVRIGSGAVVCYNCGTWCSSPPKPPAQ